MACEKQERVPTCPLSTLILSLPTFRVCLPSLVNYFYSSQILPHPQVYYSNFLGNEVDKTEYKHSSH